MISLKMGDFLILMLLLTTSLFGYYFKKIIQQMMRKSDSRKEYLPNMRLETNLPVKDNETASIILGLARLINIRMTYALVKLM